MNIGELSIRKSVTTIVLTVALVVAGITSFNRMGRLEDPEFLIKKALVFTSYPGASAEEVELEVTDVLERAAQELGQVRYVESRSSRGLSIVKVNIHDEYKEDRLPQVWDELRRKVNDYQNQLPPGAGPSMVFDDFGDVYGVFVAVTGEGYSYRELWDFSDFLQKELQKVQDVKKVVIYGKQRETIYVEMSREAMSELGVTQEQIYAKLGAKNVAVDAGRVKAGREDIAIDPTGEFTSEEQFGELLVSPVGSNRLVFLKDVATITRGYEDPPARLMRYDGQPAIGIGVSTVAGGNVVTMGEAIEQRLSELEAQIPQGMDLRIVSLQSQTVVESIDDFVKNLLAAIAIVVGTLLIAMGPRSGLIIGTVLFVTVVASFIFLEAWGIVLERISLGALIIALGMLVDNAIVVTEGMMVRIDQKMDRIKAASEVVAQTGMPLLGATVIGILAFAAIGTSDDNSGEITKSLFQVILVSLFMSWITAVTLTPLLCKIFLREGSGDGEAPDPYAGKLFQVYRRGLISALRFRWVTVGAVLALFVSSLIAFGYVSRAFFPDSSRPQFFVDFWAREGTHIESVSEDLRKAEEYLLGLEGVTNAITAIGGGQVRFLLTYAPEDPYPGYGQILVNVNDFRAIPTLTSRAQTELEEILPAYNINVREFSLGPGEGGKLQLRVSGIERDVVRALASKAIAVLEADGGVQGIRSDWLEKVKVLRPQLLEQQARVNGIERPDIARAYQEATLGRRVGVYREGNELIPIVARAPEVERDRGVGMNFQVFSPAAGRLIPARQVVSGISTVFEDAYIWRRDRRTTITIHADTKGELPSEMLERVKPKIEQALGVDVEQVLGRSPERWDAATIPVVDDDLLPLKDRPGYYMAWGGDAENSARASTMVLEPIPFFVALMVLITVMLFNALRQPAIIWLTVPLAIIGVAFGLLAFGQPFGFMALLGALSLMGMLIKNAIVLIDQIDVEIREGKDPYQAIVHSGVSRLRPVGLAAATTIFGMMPLLTDAFFVAMAVTIMCGLGFATVLTLVFVPVLYAIFFRVPSPAR